MDRPKYKELYLREKRNVEMLLNEISFYEGCLEYLRNKQIITYGREIVPDYCSFNNFKVVRLKVDEHYDNFYRRMQIPDEKNCNLPLLGKGTIVKEEQDSAHNE